MVATNFQGRTLKVILGEFWSKPTAEFGTFTAHMENGSEFHSWGPNVAPFWDFQDSLNFS